MVENVIILIKYSDFTDVFLKKSTKVLVKQTKVNQNTIKLEKSKQPSYRPIYNLRLIELKILKIYIKTNLANSFIKSLKLLAKALILIVSKLYNNIYLCIYYRQLNNFIMKNQYLLPLIKKFLNWISQTKYFTKLNLISAYHKTRIREENKKKTIF